MTYFEELRAIDERQKLFDASIRKSKSGSQAMDTRDEAKNEVEPRHMRVERLRRRLKQAEEEYKTACAEENEATLGRAGFGLAQETANWYINLDHVFTYHAREKLFEILGSQMQKYKRIRDTAKLFAQCILDNVPVCEDRSVAIRKLRECVMTANAAIALGGHL